MQALRGSVDVVSAVAARFGDHPWARLGTPIAYAGGWDLGRAVAWRSGHPWQREPVLHLVGEPARAEQVARPGEEVVVCGPGEQHPWTLRVIDRPCPPQPGEQHIRWLDADDEVGALLAVANPHAAVRPGSPLAGRWCGAYDDQGLVACAVETVLAAPRGHVSAVSVHPRARRQGLGAAVTAWFVREALAAGAPEVLLGVEPGNEPAERLYGRLGFSRWPMSAWTAPG